MRRILLALDDHVAAMDQALALASEGDTRLTALFVLDATWNDYLGHDWLSGSNSRGGFLEWVRDNEEDERLKTIRRFTERARHTPVEVKTAAGRVDEEILREAGRGYDLLVMAAPFARGLEVVRDGPARILAEAPCSVLFVKTAQEG